MITFSDAIHRRTRDTLVAVHLFVMKSGVLVHPNGQNDAPINT